jgi:hypothetical protein
MSNQYTYIHGYNESEVTITGFHGNNQLNDIVDFKVDPYIAVNISENAFHEYVFKPYTKFSFPSTIKSIGDNAFSNSKLNGYINVRDVNHIGDYAFQNCNIQTMNLSSVTYIGKYAFSMNSMTNVILPYANYISKGAFQYCPIKTVHFLTKEKITFVDTDAFTNLPIAYAYSFNIPYLINTGLFGDIINIDTQQKMYTPLQPRVISTIIPQTREIPVSNNCFPENTPIQTDQGIIPIQKLNISLHTIEGRRINMVTKTISEEEHLVRFMEHSIDTNCPSLPVTMSLEHKVLYKKQLVKAKELVNGTTIVLIPYHKDILYNVLVSDNIHMKVNNLIVETLSPECNIVNFYSYGPKQRRKILNHIYG